MSESSLERIADISAAPIFQGTSLPRLQRFEFTVDESALRAATQAATSSTRGPDFSGATGGGSNSDAAMTGVFADVLGRGQLRELGEFLNGRRVSEAETAYAGQIFENFLRSRLPGRHSEELLVEGQARVQVDGQSITVTDMPSQGRQRRLVDEAALQEMSVTRDMIPNNQECSICYQEITDTALVLPCAQHGCSSYFHGACIQPWLERNASCPLCRSKLKDLVRPVNSREPLGGGCPLQASILAELDEESRPWLRREHQADQPTAELELARILRGPNVEARVQLTSSASASSLPSALPRSNSRSSHAPGHSLSSIASLPGAQRIAHAGIADNAGSSEAVASHDRASRTIADDVSEPTRAVQFASATVSQADASITRPLHRQRRSSAPSVSSAQASAAVSGTPSAPGRPLAGGGWAPRGEWGRALSRSS